MRNLTDERIDLRPLLDCILEKVPVASNKTNAPLKAQPFNLGYDNAYTKGFLKEMGGTLSPLELKYLPLGAKIMIFIMALRFLTDYLNGDIYYKTKYPEHNLDRSKNQFKLLQSFVEKMVND